MRHVHRSTIRRVLVGVGTLGLASGFLAALAGPASATPPPPYATTTKVTAAVTGSSDGAHTNDAVVFTATVTSNVKKTGTPSGSVLFTITGSDDVTTVPCDNGNTVELTSGAATCSVSGGLAAELSPYSVQAAYTPDVSTYDASNGSLSETVSAGKSVTTVTSASSPTVTGQPVQFTAQVAANVPGSVAPAGSVTFDITSGSTSIACDSGDTVTLVAQSASCSVGAGLLAAGSPWLVTAAFVPSDANFLASAGSFKQLVDPDGATIAVTASANPVISGQAVSFTATVTPDTTVGGGTPTGDVVWSFTSVGGPTAECDGGNSVAIVDFTATCNLSEGLLASGASYTVTASLKDPNFTAMAATAVETVNEAPTVVTLTETPKSRAGAVTGQPILYTATVTPVGTSGIAPTGFVDFGICNGSVLGGCTGGGAEPVSTTDGVTTATFTMVGWDLPGTYTTTATYSGDDEFSGAASSSVQIVVSVAPTTITIESKNPVGANVPVELKAAVIPSVSSPQPVAPQGTLNFTITDPDGNTYNCLGGTNDITISTNNSNEGVADCTFETSSVTGKYVVTVGFANDGNYGSSKGTYKLKVN